MTKRIIAAILFALLATGSAGAQDVISIEPGLWELRISATLGGEARPERTARVCYSDEQAWNIVTTMIDRAAKRDPDCGRTHRLEGRTLSISTQCESVEDSHRLTIQNEQRDTFESHTRMTRRTTMKLSGRGESASGVLTIESTHVGPCP